MNGDDPDDEIDAWKDVVTPPEMMDSATLGIIEMLRRRRVCFFPGPGLPDGPGDLADFYQCLPFLGDCDALIFCCPGHDKEWTHARIHRVVYGGDFDHIFDRHGSVGTGHGESWIHHDELLFPQKSEELLVARAEPNVEPQLTRPPDSQFWAHFAILSMIGRAEKLHLLHIGLRGDHAWVYFLQPHGIRAARMITNPP